MRLEAPTAATLLFVLGGLFIAAGLLFLPWGYEPAPVDGWDAVDRSLAYSRLDNISSDGGPPRAGLEWYLGSGTFVVAAAGIGAIPLASRSGRARAAGLLVLGLATVHYGFSVYWTTVPDFRTGVGPWAMLGGLALVAAACLVILRVDHPRPAAHATARLSGFRAAAIAVVGGGLTTGAGATTIAGGTREHVGVLGASSQRASCGSVFDMPGQLDAHSCTGDLRTWSFIVAGLLGLTSALALGTVAAIVDPPDRQRAAAVVGAVAAGVALAAAGAWTLIIWSVS